MKRADPMPPCPLTWFNVLLGGRHKLRILWELRRGARRYSELKRALIQATGGKTITPRVLSRELKELEAAGLLSRKAFPEVPPRVEYSMTDDGHDLVPVMRSICRWAARKYPAYT